MTSLAEPIRPAAAPGGVSPAGAADPRRARRVLLLLAGATFMAGLDLFIVNVAFPDIQRSFAGTSDASLSWVLNAYTIVFAALPLPLGRLADRYGRKRGFIAGTTVFVVASVLCAVAPSVEWLIGARVLQAVGAAALVPTSLALLLGETPPARRDAAIAIWAAAGAVAAAAGPPIGGVLVELSWHWVFLVNVPIGVATIAAAVVLLRESRDETDRRLPDIAGAVVLAVGVGSVTLGIVEADRWGWGSAPTLACLIAGAAAIAWVVRRCARHPEPVVPLGLFAAPRFSAANATTVLFNVGFGAMLLGAVLFLTRVWHSSVLEAGLQIAPGPLMAAVFAVVGERLVRRAGYRAVAALGSLVFAASALLFVVTLDATPDFTGGFLPFMMLGGIGVGLVLPTLAAAVASALPPEQRATGSAVYAMSRQLGLVLGVAILVALLGSSDATDPLDAYRAGWMLVAAGGVAAAVSAAWIGAPRAVAAEPAVRSA